MTGMSRNSEPSDDDAITQAVLSDSAYEQLRYRRETFFSGSIPQKLTWQGLLLGGLALLLPLYALFPSTVVGYVPSVDPTLASPKVVLLGLVGAGIELFAAGLLVGAAVYRIHNHPLSRDQATMVLDVEDFSAYVGFAAGGMAIGLTLLYFLIGLSGGQAIENYVQAMDGANPFTASGVGLSVGELAVLAFVGCIVLLTLRLCLERRLVGLDEQ